MNILFIDPFLSKESRCNIGLGYLSSILKNAGHRVKVINYANNLKWVNSKVREMDADIIGISIKSGVPAQAVEIAQNIKRKKDSIVICGGPYVTVNGDDFFKKNTCLDLAVWGEAEGTILEIIDYMKGERKPEDIRGIIGRNGKNIFKTENRGYTADLDSLPFPDYRTFEFYSPRQESNRYDYFKENIIDYFIITSRGCPYRCIFCNAPMVLGRKLRVRSIENVIQEIIHVKNTYKTVERFNIGDDNFTLKKERAKEFCRALINNKLNITWRLPNGIRADKVDEDLISLMKESGCEAIMFGVESGSPEVFNSINKGEVLEDIENGVRLVKKYGIKMVGSFIIGLPNSTYQRDIQSIEFAKKIKIDTAKFHLFAPYVKTQAYEMISDDKDVKILHDLDNIPIFFQDGKPVCAFETKDYPAEERIRAYMKANLAFYNYAFIRNYDMSSFAFSRLKNLLEVILKYDGGNVHKHLWEMGRLFIAAVRRRLRRYFRQNKKEALCNKEA